MFRTQTNFTLLTILLSFFLRVEALTEEYFDDEAKKETFYAEALHTINYIRNLHGAEDLKLGGETMTKLAKDLTNAVIRALDDNADLVVPVGIEPFLKNRDNKFFLDGSLSYGHTTAVMGAKDYEKLTSIKGGIAARYWYRKQFPLYNFVTNNYNMLTAHLSQMIWKKTKEFRPWIDFTEKGDLVIVYVFLKYGNYEVNHNEYKNNVGGIVPPKKGEAPRKFEDFMNDGEIFVYPYKKNGEHTGRSWYSYEDYF